MLRRFLGYGLAGWCVEVAFTGVSGAFIPGGRTLRAQTYLWMLPIYGAGGIALDHVHVRLSLRGTPRWQRALVYMAAIYGIEFASAELLHRLGVGVPWKYQRGLNLRGYVRLDYAPFWYACGLLFENLSAEIGKLARPARIAPRPRRAVSPCSRDLAIAL